VEDGPDVVTLGGFLCALLMAADFVSTSVCLRFVACVFFRVLHAGLLLLFLLVEVKREPCGSPLDTG
jgi:hypothetical protein